MMIMGKKNPRVTHDKIVRIKETDNYDTDRMDCM